MKAIKIRILANEAGLGYGPSEYTATDVEVANLMIKYSLDVDPQKPHIFIEQ